MNRLEGKTALVTGASRGIGAGIARRLAGEGALVAVHFGRDAAAAAAVANDIAAQGGRAFTVGADLRDVQAIAALFEQLDREFVSRTGDRGLDILVNNAGACGGSSVAATTPAEFDLVYDLNVKGLFFVTQQAIRRLRDHGRVVNISSSTARGARPGIVPYASSKWAVNGLTLSLAAELGPRGISVNAVAPGATDTDLIAHLAQKPEFHRTIAATTAFGRLGQPEDIAEAVMMLVAPENRWVTGQIVEASGGLRL
jgi:NAD(P)-dependent dehydrogenase (short-subunit alcohol dehydrogenase family)